MSRVQTLQTPDVAFFSAIADQMPDWEMHEDPSWGRWPHYELHYSGTEGDWHGAKLYPNADSRKGMVEWHCNLYITQGNERYFILDALSYAERNASRVCSVNIGLAKAPNVVAQELQRRLLPRYLDLYAKGMARMRQAIAGKDADAVLAARLAAILGTTVRHQYNQEDKPCVLEVLGLPYMAVEHGSLTFTYTPSFSGDQAVQLCELFASWQGRA